MLADRMGSTGEKKVNGRKRHILVDVLGMLLAVLVTPANIQDRDAGAILVREAHREFPTLQLVWVDGAYNGEVIEQAATDTGIDIQMVKRTDDAKEFKVLPRRWVVERTFGWFGKYRLLSKEYERTIESSTADVLHAMTMLMLRRLTTPHDTRKEAR
jgi:putative transposase